MNAQAISPAAEKYDRYHGGEERGHQVAGEMAAFLAPGPVTEVGTCTGLIAFGFKELGHEVTGVDIDADMLTGAVARLGEENVIQADALKLPFDDGTQSNLVYVHVLHLLSDLEAGVAEAKRVLRPGGRLLAVHGVPAADLGDMTEAFAPLAPLTWLRDEPHLLDPVTERAGLRLVHRGFAGGHEGGMSPNAYADSIQGRVWSYLSNLDDNTWKTSVEPAIAGLRAVPDADRERELTWRVHFSVYEN